MFLACIKMTYALDLRAEWIAIAYDHGQMSRYKGVWSLRSNEIKKAYLHFPPVIFVDLCLPSDDAVLLYAITLFECMFMWPSNAVAFAIPAIPIDSLKCIELLGRGAR